MGQAAGTDKVPMAGRIGLLVARLYQVESRRFALWLPVFLGFGIYIYFALDRDPDPRWAGLVGLALLPLVTGWAGRCGWGALALAWAAFCTALGFAAALVSAHLANAPAIVHPLGETVEGRVLELSRSASGAPRMLLDDVVIYGVEPDETPARVRLTILDTPPDPLPRPGTRIRVYATLMPAGAPVEPGGFDFRKRAFFQRLGGVGLTRGEIVTVPPGDAESLWDRARLWLAERRDAMSRALRAAIPGANGAFAAAIIVGDRADIEEADAEALRASNLAHLLAISGLHMGMLTGLVFALMRLVLALVPWTAYRLSTKKTAAVVALLAGAGYLALSGATVATQRAFIMVAVAFLAVILGRPAITLRALAVAAAVILLIRPVSLLDAGFQMSFAATAALVAGYEALGRRTGARPAGGGIARRAARLAALYVVGILGSSLLAGLATAPIAAFHFNRTAPYGLLANLLALPVMGLWIAPMACLAALLAPFGLDGWALTQMGHGIGHVLSVAHWVAALPGAVQGVHAAPGIVLALIVLGGLWLAIWRGRWRLAGVAPVAAGLVLWVLAPARPDVLIAPEGRLIGVMTGAGRVLDHDRAQSFVAETWLRRDGDLATQAEAAARPGLTRIKGGLSAVLPHGWRVEMRWGRAWEPADLRRLCRERVVLVTRAGDAPGGPCLAIGPREFRRMGAVALYAGPDEVRIVPAKDPQRRRLWSGD